MRFLITAALVLALLCAASPALASQPRPGDTPPPTQQPFEVRMRAGFVFASPLASASADLDNPEGSGLLLRHTLTVSASELARVAGIGAGGDETIVLFQGDALRPGEKRETIPLSPLPDGTLLPEGRYDAYMWINAYSADTGEALAANYRVACFVRVMTSLAEAQAGADGVTNLTPHNASDAPARFALIVSAAALGGAHGIDTSVYGAENSFAMIALSEPVGAWESADAPLALASLPDGAPLAPGEYVAYLLRVPEDDAQPPYATARVRLRVAEAARTARPALVIAEEDALLLAQAAVDCAYLLSLVP